MIALSVLALLEDLDYRNKSQIFATCSTEALIVSFFSDKWRFLIMAGKRVKSKNIVALCRDKMDEFIAVNI